MVDIAITKDKPVFIYLTISDAGGQPANFAEADITFTVAGTSISKTIANYGIFFAHPIFHHTDEHDPCFIIRIGQDELDTIPNGNYPYNLNITYRDVVGAGTDVTNTYTGSLIVGTGRTGFSVSKVLVLQIPP